MNLFMKKVFLFNNNMKSQKKMENLLKSDLKLWSIYISLLKKVDALVKTNSLYSDYNKIYPSPELQLSWLMPKKKTI